MGIELLVKTPVRRPVVWVLRQGLHPLVLALSHKSSTPTPVVAINVNTKVTYTQSYSVM